MTGFEPGEGTHCYLPIGPVIGEELSYLFSDIWDFSNGQHFEC